MRGQGQETRVSAGAPITRFGGSVASLRLASDHGEANSDYRFYATVMFVKQFLLN
jgi:hypothetical protein